MNDAVHQLLQVVLQGLTWVMRTIETLWVWSWSQIASVFSMSWGNLPGWKLAVGLIAMIVLAAMLVVMFMRGLQAFRRIAAAFWTMALTMVGILTFVVAAGLFSRGFTWVVASVPDNFWEKLL
jgi:CHASE2 domain-containing sensor protein